MIEVGNGAQHSMSEPWDSEAAETDFGGDDCEPSPAPILPANTIKASATPAADPLQAQAVGATTLEQPWLALVPLHPMDGAEALHTGDQQFADAKATVNEFWRWAYGDLRTNVTVGALAEWIVAQLLGIAIGTRPPYSTYDLLTGGGQRIEVKSAAYLQGWDQKRRSTITFSLSRTLPWELRTGYGAERVLHADWYVFCLQHCQDPTKWDPLDLNQWAFFLLSRAEIDNFGQSQKTVALSRVVAVAKRLTAEDLRVQGLERIEPQSPTGRSREAGFGL